MEFENGGREREKKKKEKKRERDRQRDREETDGYRESKRQRGRKKYLNVRRVNKNASLMCEQRIYDHRIDIVLWALNWFFECSLTCHTHTHTHIHLDKYFETSVIFKQRWSNSIIYRLKINSFNFLFQNKSILLQSSKTKMTNFTNMLFFFSCFSLHNSDLSWIKFRICLYAYNQINKSTES